MSFKFFKRAPKNARPQDVRIFIEWIYKQQVELTHKLDEVMETRNYLRHRMSESVELEVKLADHYRQLQEISEYFSKQLGGV